MSADPDQMLQNVASNQDLHSLHTEISTHGWETKSVAPIMCVYVTHWCSRVQKAGDAISISHIYHHMQCKIIVFQHLLLSVSFFLIISNTRGIACNMAIP